MTKDILELESQKMSSDTFIDEIKNNYLSIVESTRKLIDGRQIISYKINKRSKPDFNYWCGF